METSINTAPERFLLLFQLLAQIPYVAPGQVELCSVAVMSGTATVSRASNGEVCND